MAKRCFENFKKRYQKKKSALKKSNRSGSATAPVEKAKRDFEPYQFFTWYDDYASTRTTTSNVPKRSNLQNKTYENLLNESGTSSEESAIESDFEEANDEEETPVVEAKTSLKRKQPKATKKDVTSDGETNNDKLLHQVAQTIQQRRMDLKKTDSESLYASSLAEDLRKFPE